MNVPRALSRFSFSLVFGLLTCASTVVAGDAWKADPMDWPHWRGPEMNGISREKNLVTTWSPEGENLLWKDDKLGGRSTPIVLRGKLYTIVRDNPGTAEESEKVVCVDAATGEGIWENKTNIYLSDVPDTRLGWSSVVGDPETGNVIALGVGGYFKCMNGETGETLWSHSLTEEYGLLTTYGGRTNFPVLHGNLAIISGVITGWGEMARPNHRFIAFDKRNGEAVWFNGTRPLPDDTTYSSPVMTVINGQALMIAGTGDGGIYAFQPRTGKEVWHYFASLRGVNTTPVVAGNLVICGHSEENLDDNTMGAVFALDGSKSGDLGKDGVVWRNKELFVGKSSPLVVDDRVYVVEDTGTLHVLDLKTGESIAKQKIGTSARASLIYADGKLFCGEANGRWYVFEITEDGINAVERMRLDAGMDASPIISHGRIYITTAETMYCIGKADQEPQVDSRPEWSEETAVDQDQSPAHAQVVPVESLLRQGQKQQYQVRLYNANGQYLRMAKADEVTFAVDGPGEIDAAGKYTSPGGDEHVTASVSAKLGDVTGLARVRAIPPLPWKFTFDGAEIPEPWVGVKYRNIGIDFDLHEKIRAENQLASRVFIYLQSSFTNSGRPEVRYDERGSQVTMTEFLRYLDLLDTATSLDKAKELIDPSLELLKRENVIKSWEWSETPETGMTLVAAKGDRKVDGNGVLMKITTIPKGTRSQGWFGRPDLSRTTIQADVYAVRIDQRLPDIGVIAQRYQLVLMGAQQQLRTVSWMSNEIKYKEEKFEWKQETWYTLKLETDYEEQDGKVVAIIRGKAWPRDADEPESWGIEWTDTPGNTMGSPGMFGNSKDGEVLYDNIQVKSN